MIRHPEGGHYIENFKNENVSQIYYLLKKNEKSHWHRLSKNRVKITQDNSHTLNSNRFIICYIIKLTFQNLAAINKT